MSTRLFEANQESDPAQRRMWLVWVLVRLAGVALLTGMLWYPQVDKDIFIYHRWATALYQGKLPWRGFNVEYPPGVFPSMLLPGGWEVFELQFLFFAMLADAYITKALWRGRRNGLGGWFWVFAPIAIGPVMWVRYDIFVAAAIVGFVVSIRKGNWGRAGACIAAATLVKLWPIALVLVVWRLIPAQGRRRFAGWAVGLSVAVCLPVIAWGGLPGLQYMLRYQGDRGLEIESPWVLPMQIAHSFNLNVRLLEAHGTIEYPLTGFAQVATGAVVPLLILAVAALAWFDPKRRLTVTSATMLTIVAVIFGERVLSPQYLVWAAAAVALVVDEVSLQSLRQRWHLILATVGWGITGQLFFPFYGLYVYWGWFRGDIVAIAHAEAVLVWVAIAAFYLLRRPKATVEPQPPASRSKIVPVDGSSLASAPA